MPVELPLFNYQESLFSSGIDDGPRSSSGLIHIRNQQRNGRKSVTIVQGLRENGSKLSLKQIVKAMKQNFSCNGTVIEDPAHGAVIQLQGDQRNVVRDYLEQAKIASGEQIKIHGA